MRAIPGNRLRDGDTFLLQDLMNFGLATFEFDLGYTFEVPTGAALSDGETFTLTDDVNPPVTFEFDLGDGVANGHVPVRFDQGQSPYEVGQCDRRCHPAGIRQRNSATRPDAWNKTTRSRSRSAPGLTSGYIRGQGAIGDNPTLFGPLAGRDVDMVEIQLEAGQLVTIDVDTDPFDFDSLGNSYLRLFDIDGDQLAFNNNGSAPGEPGSRRIPTWSTRRPKAGATTWRQRFRQCGLRSVCAGQWRSSGSTGNYMLGDPSGGCGFAGGNLSERTPAESAGLTSVVQSPGAALVAGRCTGHLRRTDPDSRRHERGRNRLGDSPSVGDVRWAAAIRKGFPAMRMWSACIGSRGD